MTMKSRFVLLVMAVLVVSAAHPMRAHAISRYPVTSTLATAAGGYTLGFGGDGSGSYVSSRTVTSEIQGAPGSPNDWYLTTEARTPSRTVHLDFTHAANGTDPAVAPFVSGSIPANPILQCGEDGVDLFGIPVGGTAECHLIVRFTY